jgi:hypothetical protein
MGPVSDCAPKAIIPPFMPSISGMDRGDVILTGDNSKELSYRGQDKLWSLPGRSSSSCSGGRITAWLPGIGSTLLRVRTSLAELPAAAFNPSGKGLTI